MPDAAPQLNPHADSDYMNTQERRETDGHVRDFVSIVDSQPDEKARQKMLTANGLDEDQYIVMKGRLGMQLSPEENARLQEVAKQAEQPQQQPEIETGHLPAATPTSIPPMTFTSGVKDVAGQVAGGVRDFIQPSIDLAMRTGALVGKPFDYAATAAKRGTEAALTPALTPVLGERGAKGVSEGAGTGAAAMVYGVPGQIEAGAELATAGAQKLAGVAQDVGEAYRGSRLASETGGIGGEMPTAGGAPTELPPEAEVPRYHGSKQPIESLEDYNYSPKNVYGQGLYTTDNPEIAGSAGYKGKNGVVYQTTEKNPVKFLNLEDKPPEGFADKINASNPPVDMDPSKPMREWFDDMRDESGPDTGISADTIQEYFEMARENAEQAGYGGWQHIGGKLTAGGQEHNVKVYFNPQRDLNITPYEPEAPQGAAAAADAGLAQDVKETTAKTGFTPAIRLNLPSKAGETQAVFKGQPGEIHVQILHRIPEKMVDEHIAAHGPLGDDQLGFVDKQGKYLTRAEATKAIGGGELHAYGDITPPAGPPAPQGAAAAPAAPSAAAQPGQPPAAAAPPAAETPGAAVGHTEAEVNAAAAANPMTAREIREMKIDGDDEHAIPHDHIDAVDMTRVKNYTAQVNDDDILAARQAARTGDPADVARWEKLDDHVVNEVKPAFDAVRHYAGYLLHYAPDPNTHAVLDDIANAKGIEDQVAHMRAVADLKTTAERMAFDRELAAVPKFQWRDMIYNLWIRHKLSLNSAGKKTYSDGYNIAFQLGARALAQGIDAAQSAITGAERQIPPGDWIASVRAVNEDLGNILANAKKAFVTMQPEEARALQQRYGKAFSGDIGFYDEGSTSGSLMRGSGWETKPAWHPKGAVARGIDFYGHVVSGGPRGLIAADQFSKGVQFNISLGSIAWKQGYAQATEEGLVGLEQSDRALELYRMWMAKPQDWMITEAWKDAQINTFTAPLEGNLAMLDGVRRKMPGGRLLVPFYRTQANIQIQGIRNGPLAFLSPTAMNTIMAGGAAGKLQFAKSALGSAILGYYMSKIVSGDITGDVPGNLPPNLVEDWKTNHQVYSMKGADGKWHSYEPLQPLSFQLGMLTRLARVGPYLSDAEYANACKELIAGFTHEMIGRDPMWGAIHQAAAMMEDSDAAAKYGKDFSKVAQFAGRESEGLIPQDVANVATYLDPVRRHLDTMMSHLENRNPYTRKNGLVTLNDYGDPEAVPLGYAINEFSSWRTTPAGKDQVIDEMNRLHYTTGFNVPYIPQSIGGGISGQPGAIGMPTDIGVYATALTPEEQNRWKELRGHPPGGRPSVHEALQQLISSPVYQHADDPDRKLRVDALWNAYQQRAANILIHENSGAIRQRTMVTHQMKRMERLTPAQSVLGPP